jgi:hypothetical protein
MEYTGASIPVEAYLSGVDESTWALELASNVLYIFVQRSLP